ncbi:hypothetical protein HS088_TW23G00308 [Tripterygium wilfordii]|uniref:Phosphoglycerate mutase family protein n=1 Tax=Tripterygium wilfordii TaxID=458696 RepID=A0A7J7BUR2_TRIWF|nr:uncharacterized protein LOC119993758 [Tripterygium wilfordii]KAF5725584.1 hypothetical protein HS088_TW23G00308 [Tripterygium wilfordii]
MGSTQSIQDGNGGSESEEEEEEEEEEEDVEDVRHDGELRRKIDPNLVKRVLEQEPEMLPCHASASPLSPQLSTLGTPRLGPSIKVWDPYNVLAPPPPLPPPPVFSRSFSMDEDHHQHNRTVTEVYLISHGECELNLRSDLVGGRCPAASLTANGKRQARALAVFLNSQRVTFHAVYSSPLDRARSMAVSVCQEMNFAEEHIQSSNSLMEMSLGNWEGCLCSEIYTPETLSLIDCIQPDFCAPSGESLRQVEYRMVQFLNETVLGLHGKLRSDFASNHHNESRGYSQPNSHALTNSIHDQDGQSQQPPHWDLIHRRQGLTRKKSGKSRLQVVTTIGDLEAEDEISPQEVNHRDLSERSSSSAVSSCFGIFSHSVPIKCLVTGLLGCSPVMMHKICIEDSSVTVLQHSWRTGWQIKRLNDTAHLRLL